MVTKTATKAKATKAAPTPTVPQDEKRGWLPQKAIQRKRNVKLIHAYEMLQAIEDAPADQKAKALFFYGSKLPLNYLLSLNFRKDVTLDLPEGMPPIDPKELDAQTHPDMMGLLSASVHRLMNCRPVSEVPANARITREKKEKIFVDVLLMCPLKDAEIVCSAKDKALEELYPSITEELVKQVFPAWFPKTK